MTSEKLVSNLAIMAGNEVLLLERAEQTKNGRMLGFAGGKIDSTDASGLDAALRENVEETGILPTHLKVSKFGSYLIIDNHGMLDGRQDRRVLANAYLANLVIPKPERLSLSGEHVDLLWVNVPHIIEGAMEDAFYERLLVGIPSILADLYAGHEPVVDRTLSRGSLAIVSPSH